MYRKKVLMYILCKTNHVNQSRVLKLAAVSDSLDLSCMIHSSQARVLKNSKFCSESNIEYKFKKQICMNQIPSN